MRILTFGVCIVALLFPASAIPVAQSSATITGRVIDGGTQAPIAGARVILLPAPIARPAGPMVGPPAQAVTGDDGMYTFSGVPEGRYRVQVQKIGFAPPTDTPLLQVGAGQALAGPDLRLTKGGAISGRVLDARGEPMAEVMVTAVRKPTGGSGRGRGAPALPAGQPGQTNDIGEFRISGLPAGDYYVAASPRPMIPLGQSSPSPRPLAARLSWRPTIPVRRRWPGHKSSRWQPARPSAAWSSRCCLRSGTPSRVSSSTRRTNWSAARW